MYSPDTGLSFQWEVAKSFGLQLSERQGRLSQSLDIWISHIIFKSELIHIWVGISESTLLVASIVNGTCAFNCLLSPTLDMNMGLWSLFVWVMGHPVCLNKCACTVHNWCTTTCIMYCYIHTQALKVICLIPQLWLEQEFHVSSKYRDCLFLKLNLLLLFLVLFLLLVFSDANSFCSATDFKCSFLILTMFVLK